jgi:putative flavoprotein involved in K+ transport
MGPDVDVVVIGAGQAGLSVSHELTRSAVEHVVLERDRIAETWRGRWDSFCLVTPNWSIKLPGGEYDGPDPDGYLPKDEIVGYLEAYARGFDAPVREGVEVTSLSVAPNGGFSLRTSDESLSARAVVVTTGAYQRPHRPPGSGGLPHEMLKLDADEYRNPGQLPAGPILVIGSGQTGCQLAEELLEAGLDVFLACGKAPWTYRRIGGRDVVWWAAETGFLDGTVDSLPTPRARLFANIQATGHGGGRDLTFRTLRDSGVTLLGHFAGAEGFTARFAPDLGESVAWGDARYRELCDLIRQLVAERGLPMPELHEPTPFDGTAPESLDLRGFGAVLFTGGFRPDYGWIDIAGVVDDMGWPVQTDGTSHAADGLYFAGVHFLRKRKSSIFYGVGEDATIVADQVAARAATGVGA